MNKKTLIIAEAGVNHNGDLATAKELALKAKKAGADCVKFQTFITSNILTTFAPKADYQVKNTNEIESQFDMIKKLELSFSEFTELYNYCKSIDINFLSTGFDIESINFLKKLGQNTWKIPSGEITNLPMLEIIGSFNQNIILSTGMATIDEISDALNILIKSGTPKSKITILHCTTEYPAPLPSINLLAMNSIKEKFEINVGYSDHTEGIEVSIAAVALGATAIEKHFTLDKQMPGPDHKASLEPDELNSLVKSIRNVDIALGTTEKIVGPEEEKNKLIARKSLVAKKHIKKGEEFTKDNLTCKRPGNGISPMKYYEIIGAKSEKDFEPDELITISPP